MDKNFGVKFNEELIMTKDTLSIVSPFISYKTANYLADWLDSTDKDIHCTIITRFNREEFLQGSNSLEGLEALYKSGASIYALQHLHSKLYIFDNRSAILGSANFSISGFFKNHELGIFVKDEIDFIGNIINYASNLLHSIKEAGDFEVTQDVINKEKKHVIERLSQRTSRSTKYKNQHRWGAIVDNHENEKEIMDVYVDNGHFDIIEKVIEDEPTPPTKGTGIWLKFEGISEDRIPNTNHYKERKVILHEVVNRTYYPRPPKSVQSGDIIFMATVSYDKNGVKTPMIVGYATAGGFDDSNVVDKNNKEYLHFNNRYPYFIELYDARFLKTTISEGIPLIELCSTLKHNVYPKTQLKPNTPMKSILKRHHQKAHIQITPEARDYLIKRLESLFQESGYDDLKEENRY